MKASDYIAVTLEKKGVTHVFELVGGMITFLLDSLHKETSIKIVSMHHEQGAGFAAEGFGRIKGIPGVAMATSGPGATNLLTAIGSCYFDSVPAVFITGQVNRHEQKGGRAIRQLGFQETDIVSMAKPITKAAWLVNDPESLPQLLDQAFSLACEGRPGPVLIDIPMDVQRSEVPGTPVDAKAGSPDPAVPGASDNLQSFMAELGEALTRARRPLVLAGGGINSGQARSAFRSFIEALGVPVVHSLMGVDLLPASHPLRVGLIGSYGNRWANTVLSESDLLLVLGSRLDVRQTGADTAGFKGDRQIFHVDCEAGELNNRVTGCTTLVSTLKDFLGHPPPSFMHPPGKVDWIERLAELRARWPDTKEFGRDETGINPNVFMHALSKVSTEARAFVVDVGQHQMWAAQSLQLGANQRFLTSGGMGAMGFALPTAIGACFAAGSSPVVVVAGDGGFQLNIQELQTVIRNVLPLKIIVLNNQCHGMVRQFQDSYFKGRVQSTVWGYSAPSFASVAKAYGIDAAFVDTEAGVDAALRSCWLDPKTPFLLEVAISLSANAYPKMAFGRGLAEMEPLAQPIEMEGT